MCVIVFRRKNVWIIKSLPIAPKMIYDSKILMNLSLSIPASFISAVLLIIGLKLDAWSSLFIIITPLTYSLFSAVWGFLLIIDLGIMIGYQKRK